MSGTRRDLTQAEYPIEDYATAWPETAQPTSDEPAGDPGHLLSDEAWAAVVAGAEDAS